MAKSIYEFEGSVLENWLNDYLNNNGNIKSDPSKVNSFLKELYQMISNDLDMISLPDDGQAVLYAGWHSDVAMWQLVDSITEQTDNYYYISDTPAGMLMGKERDGFQQILKNIIGEEYVDMVFNSTTKEFPETEALEGIINFNDFVSQNLANKYVGNDGNALIFVSDYNPDSVLIRTEIPTLLQKESIKTINGIPKESLIAYCEAFAGADNELTGYQKVVEVLSNISEDYLADTKILVITDAQKAELITQYGEEAVNQIVSEMNIIVDTSEWADSSNVSVHGIANDTTIYEAIAEFTSANNKNSGVQNTSGLNAFIEFEEGRTYNRNSAGELIYDVTKVPEGYTAKAWFDLVSKSDADVLSEAELLEKYAFLESGSQTDIDSFRAFEYYISKGVSSENIISNGIISDIDLISKHSFLADCTQTDLNAYRDYEYLNSIGASDVAIRKTGLLPDTDIKFKYEFLSDCTDSNILNQFRNYEYILTHEIAKATADSMSATNIFLNSNGKFVSMSDVATGEIPTESVYKITMGDAKNFLLDDVMETMYPDYNNLSALEKIQAKQVDYDYRQVKLKLDAVPISNTTMSRYLTAAGKTADRLNDTDRILMRMADSMAGGNDDILKSITKFSDSCKGISKAAKTALPVVDAVGTIAIASVSIYNAVKLYEAGQEEQASAIMTGCAIDVVGGIAGGSALTGAISPYLMGFGAAIGGPADRLSSHFQYIHHNTEYDYKFLPCSFHHSKPEINFPRILFLTSGTPFII